MSITQDQAYEFAAAMGGTHPPTNTHLIQKHINWWEQNHPEHADAVRAWYESWTAKVEDDELADSKAYRQFTNVLDDLGIDY